MRLFTIALLGMSLFFLNSSILLALDDTSAAGPDDSVINHFGLPVFYGTPETGIAVGGYFMAYRNLNSATALGKLDYLNGAIIYTQKEQIIFNLGLKNYFRDERYLLMVNCGYLDFPSKYYGIGPNTDKDLEEDYTLISKFYQGSLLWRLAPNLYLGPSVTYFWFGIEDRTEDGLLAAGNINGYDGAKVAGGGLKLIWDSRDDGFLPQHGSLFDAQMIKYSKNWGSDEDFSQLTTIYEQFWPVRQTGTLAFMSVLYLSEGTVPFEMMPLLGGQTIMRGYYQGRFRDHNYVALQGEYRFPIIGRFSGVTFLGLGEVAPEKDQFNSENLKVAGGFGFRFRIDPKQKINLRLDIGASEDGIFSYISFMEAF